jgi:hypothetical protein
MSPELDGLLFDTDAILHLARTEQRALIAILSRDDGDACDPLTIEGSAWHFDGDS